MAAIAHEHGHAADRRQHLRHAVPCRPFEYGADIVVHSATKFIGGHGTSIGGVIVDGGQVRLGRSGKFPRLTEPDPAYHGVRYTEAFGRWPTSSGPGSSCCATWAAAVAPSTPSCSCRGWRRCTCGWSGTRENALEVARYLEEHPAVEWVNYPGLERPRITRWRRGTCPGGRAPFSPSASAAAWRPGETSSKALKLFSHLANVGDAKSLVIHPASTTHQQLTPEEQRPPGSRPDWCGCRWAPSTSTISSRTWTRPWSGRRTDSGGSSGRGVPVRQTVRPSRLCR